MIFSHPATNGFLMWGFWDGAHWKDNAPYFIKTGRRIFYTRHLQ